MITREQLEERLKVLRQDQVQTLATVNAIGGAIQDCQYWLSVLDGREEIDSQKGGDVL